MTKEQIIKMLNTSSFSNTFKQHIRKHKINIIFNISK